MRRIFLIITAALFPALAVATAQWEPDRKLSTSDSSAFGNENMGPTLVARGDTVHAVWYDAKNNGSAVYYRRSTDKGMNWSADLRLSSSPGAEDFPSLAVAGEVVHVLSRGSAGGKSVTLYRRSPDGGASWNPPLVLDTMYWWPSVAASGSLVTVAENDNYLPGNSEVFFRRSTDAGMHWDSLRRISNAPDRSEDPAIATSGGFVHMVWNDKRSGIMQSYYRRSSDAGVNWGNETALSNSTVMAYSPMVSVDGPHVEVVWEDRRTGNYEIWRRHSSDYGATWEKEEQLTFSSPASNLYPVAARDRERIHIVWFGAGLQYIRSTDNGATWSAPAVLVDSAKHPVRPYMALSGPMIHLIWSDNRSGHAAMYYTRNPTGNEGSKTGVAGSALPDRSSAYAAAPNPFRTFTIIPGHETEEFFLYDATGRMEGRVRGANVAGDLPGGVYLIVPVERRGGMVRILKIR